MSDAADPGSWADPGGNGHDPGPPGWAQPSAPTPASGGQPFAPPPFTPERAAAPPGGSAPLFGGQVSPDQRAQLNAARGAGQRAVRNGGIWLAVGVAITVGSLVLAPGGFMIISFGPVIVGVRMIMRGRAHLTKVDAAERSLRRGM